MPEISKLQLYQGNDYIDQVVWGERLHRIDNNVTDLKPNSKPEDFVQWDRVAREVAKAGLPVLIHSTLEAAMEQQLVQVELVNKQYPVKNLRWAFAHLEQITPSQIARMKRMGMVPSVFVELHHTRTVVSVRNDEAAVGKPVHEAPPNRVVRFHAVGCCTVCASLLAVSPARPASLLDAADRACGTPPSQGDRCSPNSSTINSRCAMPGVYSRPES